ncbi:hypothetical protein B0H19DRAFT_1062310 [Mycena capillaripes]|nr:hypothetical protein B0H19DRAFT_1062310 [Mycena capillaripes]
MGSAIGHTVQPLDISPFCSDPLSSRTLLDIIWGCLATVFACTWVSVHPNVPAPGQTNFVLVSRRLGMMLLAIIAPELIIFFAARQYFFASAFSKRFDISVTQASSSRWGDSFLRTDCILSRRCNSSKILSWVIDTWRIYAPSTSKGDALSKAVALLQSCWFIIQCVARGMQHLPLTELEVATLAFAGVNIVTWILWFRKPLAVQFPIPIGPPAVQGSHSASREKISSSFNVSASITGAIYGSGGYDPASSGAVPMLWSPPMPEYFLHSFLLEMVVAVIFGVIHCTAWAATFPSAPEKWLWRLSALTITAIPALMGIVQVAVRPSVDWSTVIEGSFFGSLGIYVVSRLLLIVLPFTTLRRIPVEALSDINWSADIPHFLLDHNYITWTTQVLRKRINLRHRNYITHPGQFKQRVFSEAIHLFGWSGGTRKPRVSYRTRHFEYLSQQLHRQATDRGKNALTCTEMSNQGRLYKARHEDSPLKGLVAKHWSEVFRGFGLYEWDVEEIGTF